MNNKFKNLILKLPKKVQRFIEEKIEFEEISNVAAITINTKHYKPWIIIFTERIPDSMFIHEIAHAWLGHKPSNSDKEKEKRENEADKQSENWGFKINYNRNQEPLEYLYNYYKEKGAEA